MISCFSLQYETEKKFTVYCVFSIDIWTLLDIDLLDMVKDIFTEDALKIYIKELLSILGKNPRNNLDRITLDVISRCIFQIILYGNQEDSDYYLNELKTIQLPDYFMLQKLYLKELEAAYLYKFIDKNMGNSLHKEVLHYLAFMGDDDNLRECDQIFRQL